MQKVDGDPNAANATDRVDTVVIETEILFGGVAGEQPPKDEVDNYMAANKKDLGVEEFGLSRGTSSALFFQLFWPNSRRNKLKVFAKLKDFSLNSRIYC